MANDKLIKLKIVLDDKGVPVKLESLEKGIKDIDLTTKNAEGSVKKLNAAISNVGLKGGALKSIKVTQSEYSKLAKTQHQLKDSTGSATAATMELTRVISDAPYGIRGMANNITQLVAQMGTATTKAGSFGGALKQMGKSLLGPAGIVLAITTVVSILDELYGGMTKAKESTDDLNNSLNAFGGKTFLMNQYYNVLNNVNSSEQERKVAIQELEKLVPSLKDKEIDYRKELDKVRESIDSYVLSQASRIEIDKLVEQNSELLTKKSRIRRINEIKDEKKKFEEIKKILKENEIKTTRVVPKQYNPYRTGGGGFIDVDRTKKELKEDFDKIAENVEKSSQPILDRIDELRKGLEFVPKKDSTKKKTKGTRTEIDVRVNTDSFTNLMESDDWQSLLEDIDKMNTEVEEVGAYTDDQRIQKEIDREAKEKKARLEKLEELKLYAEKSKEILASISNFVSAEFEREMTIEQNKTNAKNEQLNARLRNEQLSEEKRKEILNQIAINDENLRKKQEVIAKKKFKAEKAFNISMALINTFSAATGVLRDTKGGTLARILGMTAVITAGLAQVATISRQKYQSTASASPSSTVTSTGGSSTSSVEREMNFNIVGNSNSTQLVDAIQSKFEQPLKAYVVSREITSSQALESNIVETASL